MRLAETLEMLVAVPRQTDLDLIVAVLRERIRYQGPAARPDWQPLDVFLLGQVRPDADCVAPGRPASTADGQAADPLRRGDITIQQRRRKIAHRHVVESVAGIIVRQHRRCVDGERQEVTDGVLVLSPIEPPERAGFALGLVSERPHDRASLQERRRSSRMRARAVALRPPAASGERRAS